MPKSNDQIAQDRKKTEESFSRTYYSNRHSESLFQFARCLHRRNRKQGTLSTDLEEAITLGRAALDLRPAGCPNRSHSFHNPALFFSDRYGKQTSVEAIALGRAALKLRPPGHPDRAQTPLALGRT